MSNLSFPDTPIKLYYHANNFKKHLGSNKKILFSGAFGIGKTFFLKHFFETPEMSEKYNVFHLFPINYQVTSNEDIFELLKYDILCHLLSFEWGKHDSEEFSNSLALQSYVTNKHGYIISNVLKCMPVLSTASKVFEAINTIQKDFNKYRDKLKNNENIMLDHFINQLENQQGSIYEYDAITNYICNAFEKYKRENTKENILIIDDLDRIDPEHIFRLLNVFSAHFDIDEGTNKFGFDKIIFVCDIENIRNIFAAKYGQKTDFSGYIDKFSNSGIFYFNNKTVIQEYVMKIMGENLEESKQNQNGYFQEEIECIKYILYLLIEGKSINIRKIANVKMMKNDNFEIGLINRDHYLGLAVIKTLIRILGGRKGDLIKALENMIFPTNEKFNINNLYIAALILPLTEDKIYDTSIILNSNEIEPVYAKGGIVIKYKLERHRYSHSHIYAKLDQLNTITFETLKMIMLDAVNMLDQKGYL